MKLEDRVYIKSLKVKGVIKEENNGNVDDIDYKVTYFNAKGERETKWFKREDLETWKPRRRKRVYSINCIIDDESLLPKYETICASGMDLRAYKYSLPSNLDKEFILDEQKGVTLEPFQRILIKTGLRIELPPNVEAQIRPRGGLALKNGISIVNSPGTVDEDYRGDIGIILINLSDKPFTIKKGDRVAQMVFQKVYKYNLNVATELSATVRGEGAYGHTGK